MAPVETPLSTDERLSKGHRQVAEENANFMEFIGRLGEGAATEVLERIGDAMWRGKGDGIRFSDVHQLNACNHVASGTIRYGEEDFGFIIESGDINGTVIHEWGDPDDVGTFEPPKPTLYTFVPQDDFLKDRRPEMYKVYEYWTQQEWFKEKVRSYNYDRHFAPGCTTESHYRDWAARKGMKVAIQESAS